MYDDLISRKAAIDRINKQREHLRPDIFPQDKIGDAAYRICAEFIERLPSAQPEQRWIPVAERLPEKGNEVLVCYDFKGRRSVLIGVLWGDGKFHGFDEEYLTPEGRKYRKAVAWMPLPEPYREEGDEE